MTITAKNTKLSRDEIVNSAVDLFGYAYFDFDGMTSDEILVYLDNDDGAVEDILEYNYPEGIVPQTVRKVHNNHKDIPKETRPDEPQDPRD